jgi:5-methylthioadenosine/S-adenosylhomocysteine deaminase
MPSRVIDNVAVYTPTATGTHWLQSGHIVINDGTIAAVSEGRWPGTGAEIIDGGGDVALPGFVNTHTHSNLGLYQGIWDTQRFAPKPAKYPLQQAGAPPYTEFMTPAEHRFANYLTMIAALRSGTTTLCSCDRYYPTLTVEAAEQIGIRTHSGPMANHPSLRPVGPPNWPEVRDEMVSLITANRGNPLRRFFIGAHSIYSCTPEQLQEAHEAARDQNVDFNIHLAEATSETTFTRDHYGLTPVRFLAQLGILDDRVIADHVIFVDDEEIDILEPRGVRIASCPFGTAKSGKVAPLLEYMRRGMPVGIGTDSLMSNNAVSMIRELALVIQLQRVREAEGGLLYPDDAIRLATLGGARVLGWQEDIGSLETGKAADIVLFRLRHPWGLTAERVESELVFAADRNDVAMVLVAGEVVVANGRVLTVDEDALWRELADRYQRGGPSEWHADYQPPGLPRI